MKTAENCALSSGGQSTFWLGSSLASWHCFTPIIWSCSSPILSFTRHGSSSTFWPVSSSKLWSPAAHSSSRIFSFCSNYFIFFHICGSLISSWIHSWHWSYDPLHLLCILPHSPPHPVTSWHYPSLRDPLLDTIMEEISQSKINKTKNASLMFHYSTKSRIRKMSPELKCWLH